MVSKLVHPRGEGMDMKNRTIEIWWEDCHLEVKCYIGNNGIGPYEFWGAKGFDKGQDYVEEFVIKSGTDQEGRELQPFEIDALQEDLEDNQEFHELLGAESFEEVGG